MHLHNPVELITDAQEALQLLKDGNERFVKGELSRKDDYENIRESLNDGQKPFAIILCCADSRVDPEIYFDQKLGDIFVIRNAGNVVDDVVLGSIEYGAEHLGCPLMVVVGHTNCGAVTAAVEGGEAPDHILSIIKKIRPSIKEGETIDEVAVENAKAMAKEIANDDMVKRLGTKVVPAIYDILTGKVTWL